MSKQRVPGTRRMWLPAACMGLFAVAVIARLVQVQVLEHDTYAAQAEAELSGSSTFYAQRGAILDRNGNVLSSSVDTWDIYVNSRVWRDGPTASKGAAVLGEALGLDPVVLRQDVETRGLIDVIVADDVPYDVGKTIIDSRLPGVIALPNVERAHPEEDTAAGLIGIIGRDNVGLSGIEASLNDALQGKPGRAIFERDTSGEPIPYGQYLATAAVPGKDVVLTIDRNLQRLAETTLDESITKHRAKGGTILIMDPRNGAILAMATRPTLLYSQLDLDDENIVGLLRNRAVTDLYEPGSVMKVVTAAAAVDAGLVSPDTTYYDSGSTRIYETEIFNWDYNVYGTQTMTGVLKNSINTGAIYMVDMLGAERFHAYLEAFGFGQPTGIELTGEAAGIHRQPSDPGWSPVDLATQSFGQSISVTPIQMASAIAAVINGGNLYRPHLVKAYIDHKGNREEVRPELLGNPITSATSAALRGMMEETISSEWGTHPAQPKHYTAGGKSGTANVPIYGGVYDDTQVASFIGYAPAEDPQILVLVKLDENADLLTGTQAAGPIFAHIVDETLNYLNVRPIQVQRPSQGDAE
jgi:stage V sporulation protein D (sporulation-specific penicillin-binding protein)